MTSRLHEERLAAVLAALRAAGAGSVLDLGCGDGDLLLRLLAEPTVGRVVGVDLSAQALRRLRARLAALPPAARDKAALVHASFTEPDDRFAGFDAAVLLETIEHIEPDRLSLLERAVFRAAAPALVLVTTPNRDANALLGVPAHRLRHPDHRFEWGRARFRAWAEGVAGRTGYDVAFGDLAGGTQMATFSRRRPPSPA